MTKPNKPPKPRSTEYPSKMLAKRYEFELAFRMEQLRLFTEQVQIVCKNPENVEERKRLLKQSLMIQGELN